MKKNAAGVALFRLPDVLLCLIIVGLAALLFFLPFCSGTGRTLLVITADETMVYTLDKNEVFMLQSNGYTLVIAIEEGAAFVRETDCPAQICRRTGRISRPGESIICSRAGVLLRVEGGNDYDAIAG